HQPSSKSLSERSFASMANHPSIEILIPKALSDLEIQGFYVWLVTVSKSVIKRRPIERRNQVHAEQLREKREFLDLRLQLWQDESINLQVRDELGRLQATIERQSHHLWEVAVTGGQQFEINPITM